MSQSHLHGPSGPVVVVTGPTASGKSALGVEIALRFDGEVLNADSMQVYRYLDIGTAKPSLEERARVPHHLFDVVAPDVNYSAGRYAREAREAAAQVHARRKLVVLVGGTGLYIRAFLEGLVQTGEPDAELREQLEREHARATREGDPGRLHRRLQELDPRAGRRIHPNDLRRTIRALEICQQSGESASALRGGHAFADRPYASLHLALDPERETLAVHIDRRCKWMIESGLLREVRGLRELGYGPELRCMQAIGYRHMRPVVDGSDTLANALVEMQRDTRRFAKRQRTWLRGVPEAIWMDPRDESSIYRAVEGFLAQKEGPGG
jgi:tRNA dimethylallyltransferase